MSVNLCGLLRRAGKIVGGWGHVLDVTERKRVEQQGAGQKLDAIGQLARGSAHDFTIS